MSILSPDINNWPFSSLPLLNTLTFGKSPDNKERFILFYSKNDFLSNFFNCNFISDNINFNCTEQYFHYKKAIFFEDFNQAEKILNAKNPTEQKRLGRNVQNFDEHKWKIESKNVMFNGNHAKFTQDNYLNNLLKMTTGWTLVEASPFDLFWGIGLRKTDPKAFDRSEWRGANHLGIILENVRNVLNEREMNKRRSC